MMKILFTKSPGGVLVPASDIEAGKMEKFKTGESYEVEIKRSRNPAFLRKAFALFNFCFEHWQGEQSFLDEAAQFDKFRKDLTCLAGYRHTLVNIRGEARVEAMSLSFGAMSEDEFEQCYSAIVNAAIRNIFNGSQDAEIESRLMSFF